jgi:hypothetical protein
MKRQFIFGTMLSAALAMGVSAQQPDQDRARSGQSQSDRTVTVTGCLQPASRPGSAGATTGDTTSRQGQAGSSSAQYILTDASMSGSASTGAAAGTGTTGTAAGAATGAGTGAATGAGASTPKSSSPDSSKTYRLTGGQSDQLQQYVNSQVEVTGRLVSQDDRRGTSGTGSAAGTGSTGAGTGAGTGTGAGAGAGTGSSGSMAGGGNMQTLQVTSVRQVSSSCTGGERR